MRKFLYPLPFVALLCVFLFNCSNEGFEKPKPSDIASWAGLEAIDDTPVKCFVGESCYEISRSSCYIIGGEEKDSTCVSFTCGWNHETVKYGEEAILSFAFKSDSIAQEEGCSLKKIISYIPSYGTKELVRGNEYTISASTIPGLKYSEDANIVTEATVTCGDKTIPHKCKSLTVKSVPMEFSCKWTPNKVNYGGKSTLSFAFDPASADIAEKEGCVPKISPLNPGEEHIINARNIAGLSYSKDTTITAKATVTCGTYDLPVKDCDALKVNAVPGPVITGGLSFKEDKVNFVSNDSNYFFIGTKVDSTYINNTIKITNSQEAGCSDSDVKIKIEGSPAKPDTSVRATAVVICKNIGDDELVLGGISAEVLPNYKIGKCELAGNSKTTMLSKDTLTVAIDTSDIYGRCNKVEYTFNGTTYSSSNSFVLANSGNTDLKNIKAKVTCNGKDTTVVCPTVTVASYIYSTTCKDGTYDIDIPKGTTIIGLACSTSKNGKGDDGADNNWNAYYINCQNKDYNLSVSGGRIKEAPGNGLSYNFFPDTEPIKEGNLYRYPYDIIIKADEVLKCGIW